MTRNEDDENVSGTRASIFGQLTGRAVTDVVGGRRRKPLLTLWFVFAYIPDRVTKGEQITQQSMLITCTQHSCLHSNGCATIIDRHPEADFYLLGQCMQF
jgi:hypothetical protein